MISEHLSLPAVSARLLVVVRWIRAKLLLTISWVPLPVVLGTALIVLTESLYNVFIRITRGAHYEEHILPRYRPVETRNTLISSRPMR